MGLQADSEMEQELPANMSTENTDYEYQLGLRGYESAFKQESYFGRL